ncbi:MAG: hypothetical protein Q8L55_13760 [Phycisphaerales bacterium]|nr:hypothetical protein [Phycisphaerales bacterium]
MRAQSAFFVVALSATVALGQVTLPPSTRRPEAPKPVEPPAPQVVPPTPKSGDPSQVPANFPGSLQPVVGATPLSDEALTVETAGLSMNLPLGSVVVQSSNTEGTVHRIVAEDQSWSIEVQVRRSARADATVHDTAELISRNIEQLAPVVTPGRGDIKARLESNVELLQRLTQFTIAGCPEPGERLYFAVPGSGSRRIMGYTILKPMPATFVIFEFACDDSKFEKARAAYELCVATARFEDPTRLIEARAAALTAGTEFLAQLSEEKLARLGDDTERWYRWSRPSLAAGAAAGGDGTEIGYRIQKVSKGRRSDIGAEGGSGRDNPSGLVVTTQVRVLQRGAGGGKVSSVIDSDTKAFTSFDRKDEAWVTTTILRDLKTPGAAAKPSVYSETGVRSGNSMSIVSRAPGKGDSVVSPVLRSTQYVTVGESQFLGSLLVLDNSAAGAAAGNGGGAPIELGFYAYRADTGTVSLRREAVGRDPSRANAWTVRSRQRDEKAATVNVYRDDGTLVRSELVDGSTWEPIEPEALLKIWKSKNLPVK